MNVSWGSRHQKPGGSGGETSLKYIEVEAGLWKILPITTCINVAIEDSITVNGSKQKFFLVRNVFENAVYIIINVSYIFFISDGNHVSYYLLEFL